MVVALIDLNAELANRNPINSPTIGLQDVIVRELTDPEKMMWTRWSLTPPPWVVHAVVNGGSTITKKYFTNTHAIATATTAVLAADATVAYLG